MPTVQRSAIIGFGMNIPHERIRVTEIAARWNQDGDAISASLGVREKSVPAEGDDTFTLAFHAASQALEISPCMPAEVAAVYVGSESHPYAVKPTSGMVADALGCDPFCYCADLEFACKAGTAAMQIVDSMIRSKQIRYGFAIGADTAQSKPSDALEYTAAAGAAALLMGPSTAKDALCQIDQTLSFTTDTPDFWRGAHATYPSHAGRFTGEPGYFHHMRETVRGMMEVSKVTAKDIDHVVFHMPNGKFPSRVAKEFGFTKEQMALGFIVPSIGNTYSACSLIGLAHVLQEAKKDERILLVSYGSGAGCDAFMLTMLRDGMPLPGKSAEPSYLTYNEYRQRTAVHV